MKEFFLRKAITADVEAIRKVIDSSGIFPSEYLDDMISSYLSNPDSEEIWFVYIHNNQAVGFGYCVPEKLTDGTYNLLAIAVDKMYQGNGVGGKMMRYIEDELRSQGRRILIVDTSSHEDFAPTRSFYLKEGYTNAATIKDFWKDGEDKVTFYKKLL